MSFGTTLLIGPLIGIAFSPLIGHVSDHYENKRVMIISQIGCILLLLFYSFLFLLFGQWHYLMVLFIVATTSLNMRLFNITYLAAVSRLVDKPFIQQLNSLEQSSTSLANILGPIVAGVLFALVPFPFFIWFEIGAEFLVVLIVLNMNFHLIQMPEEAIAGSETIWTSMKQGLAYVKKRKLIFYLILFASLFNFLFGVVEVGFPYLIVHVLHLENLQYSLTEALFSLGMVIGGLAASKLKVEGNPAGMVSKALILEGLPIIFVLIPLMVRLNTWMSTAIFSLISFALAVILVFVNVPMQTYMQQTVPSNYQGRVFTIMMVGCTSLQPVGLFVYGLLFQYTSAIVVITVSFFCLVLIGSLVRFLTGKADLSDELLNYHLL